MREKTKVPEREREGRRLPLVNCGGKKTARKKERGGGREKGKGRDL